MKELLDYILKEILAKEDYEIVEEREEERQNFLVRVPNKSVGIVIGKGGRMVKAIRNLLKVRATLEKKGVSLSIEAKD